MAYLDLTARPQISAADAAALRLGTEAQFKLGQVACLTTSRRLYMWDPASVAADDGTNVIKPNSVGGGSPGRWVVLGFDASSVALTYVLRDSGGGIFANSLTVVSNITATGHLILTSGAANELFLRSNKIHLQDQAANERMEITTGSALVFSANEFETSVTYTQAKRTGNGANAGATTTIKAQDGQNVAAGTNNNGGNLEFVAGGLGTGGTDGLDGLIIHKHGATTCLTERRLLGDYRWILGAGQSYMLFEANGGTQGVFFQAIGASGSVTFQTRAVVFSDSVGPTERVRIDTNNSQITWESAAGANVYSQTKRGGTGANAGSLMTIKAQDGQNVAAGTNNIGGTLVLASGAVGTGGANGFHGSIRLSLGGSEVTVDLSDTGTNARTLSFVKTATFNVLHANKSSGEGAGVDLTITAQGTTDTNQAGGSLNLRGGAKDGTGVKGGVRLEFNATTESMVEIAEIATGRRVVSLAKGARVTTSHVPSGDKVTYFGEVGTTPSSNPTEGFLLWSESGRVMWRDVNGTRVRWLDPAATAAAGAGALPATPQEFLTIEVNGNTRKIPLYLN